MYSLFFFSYAKFSQFSVYFTLTAHLSLAQLYGQTGLDCFLFKVITDAAGFKSSILPFVFCLLPMFFVPFFSFPASFR